MRITNGGNVGIGTTSPEGNLHVQDSSNAIFVLDANADAKNTTIKLLEQGGLLATDYGAIIRYHQSDRLEI